MATLIRGRCPRQPLEAGPKGVLGRVYFRITPANAQHGHAASSNHGANTSLSPTQARFRNAGEVGAGFETRDVWRGSEVLVRTIPHSLPRQSPSPPRL